MTRSDIIVHNMEREERKLVGEQRKHAIRVIERLERLAENPINTEKETSHDTQLIIEEIVYNKINKLRARVK